MCLLLVSIIWIGVVDEDNREERRGRGDENAMRVCRKGKEILNIKNCCCRIKYEKLKEKRGKSVDGDGRNVEIMS